MTDKREARGKSAGAVSGRELALDILMEILERGAPSHVVLRQALAKYRYLDKQERAFITRVTEGTLEYQLQLDVILDQYSGTKVRDMKPLIRTLLRMSVYQILYMDRVPDAAVCSEAVKLAGKRHFTGLKGYVNGVLRSIVRGKEELLLWLYPPAAEGGASEAADSTGRQERQQPTASPYSVRYSMPQWLIDLWNNAYGEECTRGMLEAFLKESPFSVRCNLDKAPKAEIIESLCAQGVVVVENEYADDMLYLENIDYPERLEVFRKGLVVPQDFSSACVAKAAGIRAGDQILDVCGAPGGKSLHAASLLRLAEMEAGEDKEPEPEEIRTCRSADETPEQIRADDASEQIPADRAIEQISADLKPGHLTGRVSGRDSAALQSGRRTVPRTAGEAGSESRGHIFVRDKNSRRMAMIDENIRRCGYEDIVSVQIRDALLPDPEMEEKADVVFADLPCSGLGVIGRKPDIKGRIRPEDIETLAKLQRDILSVVWRYVKQGGILVYSTCTVTPQENNRNREWFLDRYPFDPVDISGRLGEKFCEKTLEDGWIQFLPGRDPCDGFFLAVMRRR